MTNATPTPELYAELQELYLTGEAWLDDIAQAENDTMLQLQKIFGTVHTDGFDDTCHDRALLRRNIAIFMNKVGGLMVEAHESIGIELIEDFIDLQTAVRNVLTQLRDNNFTRRGCTQAA